jgi:hypothetical protein
MGVLHQKSAPLQMWTVALALLLQNDEEDSTRKGDTVVRNCDLLNN